NRSLNCLVDHTESGACQGRCERLTRLKGWSGAECVRQLSRRIAEVRNVEDVEHFCSELYIGRFRYDELLGYDEVLLNKLRPVNHVALQIAKGARLRYCKSRRIEDCSILVDERVHSGKQVRATHVARIASARRVDHRRATRRRVPEEIARRVHVEYVRSRDLHRDWQAASGVHNRADVPTTEQHPAHT